MIKINSLPNADLVRSLLDYSIVTGKFYWKKTKGPVKSGDLAGCLNNHGRRQIKINGSKYCANRLAWLWITGDDPGESIEVDHKDCDHTNDSWLNLRLASRKDNNRNTRGRGAYSKGVSKHFGKFKASISSVDAPRVYLGLFTTEDEAAAAYSKAASNIYGEFARHTHY